MRLASQIQSFRSKQRTLGRIKARNKNQRNKNTDLAFTRSVFGFLLPIQRFGAVESLSDSVYVYFLMTNFLVVMVCPSDTIE